MPQRGRKPKPVADKLVRGNPGRRSLTTQIKRAPDGAIPCPDTVVRNQRAKGWWDHYLATTAPGHLAPVDAPLLARLCLHLALADEADEKLAASATVVLSPNGTAIQNPYLPIANRQTELTRKLAAELGLTVAQRNRTGAGDGGADDAKGILD